MRKSCIQHIALAVDNPSPSLLPWFYFYTRAQQSLKGRKRVRTGQYVRMSQSIVNSVLSRQVVEFAEYGNLYEFRDFRTIEELCRFTIQAATALEYVESKGIIHQAVNSNTCLVVSKTEVSLYDEVFVVVVVNTCELLSIKSRCFVFSPFQPVIFTGSRGDVFVVRTSKPVENL